jgi:hypothetical protein
MSVPSVQLSTIEIPVANLKRAVAWHHKALGLNCTWSDDHHALLSGATTLGSGTQILLVETSDPDVSSSIILEWSASQCG